MYWQHSVYTTRSWKTCLKMGGTDTFKKKIGQEERILEMEISIELQFLWLKNVLFHHNFTWALRKLQFGKAQTCCVLWLHWRSDSTFKKLLIFTKRSDGWWIFKMMQLKIHGAKTWSIWHITTDDNTTNLTKFIPKHPSFHSRMALNNVLRCLIKAVLESNADSDSSFFSRSPLDFTTRLGTQDTPRIIIGDFNDGLTINWWFCRF